MRKRLLLSVGLLAFVLAGFVVVLWATGHGDRINPENYARIQEGMTQEDVEEILGCPPGDYGPGIDSKIVREVEGLRFWSKGDLLILVLFDDGKVTHKGFFPTARVPGPESFAGTLRRWLGLPWC